MRTSRLEVSTYAVWPERQKRVAKRQGTTLLAIIEQGIRLALEELCDQPYQLPDKSMGGGGLQKEFSDKSWGEIREAAYKYSAH